MNDLAVLPRSLFDGRLTQEELWAVAHLAPHRGGEALVDLVYEAEQMDISYTGVEAWLIQLAKAGVLHVRIDHEGWHAALLDIPRTVPPPEPSPPPVRVRTAVLITTELRWEIFEADNFTCRDCGARRDLTVDHIVPQSKGGASERSNLQTLCRPCNSRKGVRA